MAPSSGGWRFGNGGALALVALGHIVVIALLATVKLQMDRAPLQPTEVVMVAEQTSKLELPAPKQPNLEMPQVDVPIVPIVIETVNPDATPITVVERPVQTVASADYGAPKEVTGVEYVREPNAKYPSAARALKQRGVVTLRTLVDANGQPRDVTGRYR